MDDEHNNEDLTAEEEELDQEALSEVEEDEIRNKLAEDLGIDPEVESDLLDKVFKRELTHREKLSGAIKQKISWRERAKKSSSKPSNNSEAGKTHDQEDQDLEAIVERKLNERLEVQALESLDLPEELQTEVKDLAKVKGISIREAAQLPYIRTRKEELEREARVKAATPRRTNKGSYASSYDPAKPLNPADFDLNTEEGRKAWQEAKAARSKQSS